MAASLDGCQSNLQLYYQLMLLYYDIPLMGLLVVGVKHLLWKESRKHLGWHRLHH